MEEALTEDGHGQSDLEETATHLLKYLMVLEDGCQSA